MAYKIITKQINPSIPIRCFDWVAWIDGREEIIGNGTTQSEAIESLQDCLDLYDDPTQYIKTDKNISSN